MALSDGARTWIEERTGGRITAVEQQARWREQYFVTAEVDGEPVELVARFGRDADLVKSYALFRVRDVDHEARVLHALQGEIRVPRLFGYNEDERFLLMGRLAGSDRLADAPDDETRRQVLFEYYDQLALLHGLDIEAMHLQGIEIPTTAEEIAFKGKFGFAADVYRQFRSLLRPEPLLDLGLWWLDKNVPRNDRPVRFLQGDTGPGQFMHADGHLAGLIDWELAHIGDPMLDLGVARMRNMLYPAGSLREPILHYDEITGGGVDWAALGYYTVMSMLFTPIGVVLTLQRPKGDLADLLPRFEWDITLKRGLCDALAEVLGIDLELPELPEPTDGPPTVAELMDLHVESNVAPLATDALQQLQVDKARALAAALKLESRIGPQLLSDDLDDMARLLGRRPADRADGIARLARLVDDEPEANLHALVRLFARLERRREHLWRPMMLDSASAEFEPLLPRS